MSKVSIIPLAVLFGKLLPILVKLVKTLKFTKFGLIALSGAAYAYLFTWQFSLMILVALFVHESGHIYAMKRCGMKTKGIYFIPFLGAAAIGDGEFPSRKDETYIAIMGPIWGFVLAILTGAIYFIWHNAFFAAVSGWMAMVNLFNLLPVNPLDGGRIIKSVTFSINSKLGFTFLSIGIIFFTILTFWAGLILFFVLLLFSSIELIFEYLRHKRNIEFFDKLDETEKARLLKIKEIENMTTINMSRKASIVSVIGYVIIIAILWTLMSYMNHVPEVAIAREIFMS